MPLGPTDVNELYQILMPAKEKWDRIGVLLGVDIEQLMSISQRCQRVDQCLFSMLVAWLQEKEGKQTYKKLTKVLRSKKVKEDNLAVKIIKEKGIWQFICISDIVSKLEFQVIMGGWS